MRYYVPEYGRIIVHEEGEHCWESIALSGTLLYIKVLEVSCLSVSPRNLAALKVVCHFHHYFVSLCLGFYVLWTVSKVVLILWLRVWYNLLTESIEYILRCLAKVCWWSYSA